MELPVIDTTKGLGLGLTPEETKHGLDDLLHALTNQWADGTWSWWCRSPCGGGNYTTRKEAARDLLAWANRIRKKYP